MTIDGERPAHLYRSRVYYRDELDHAESEQIGSGSFAKMLRVALSDPDGEIWRYSIRSGELKVQGDDLNDCVLRQP